MSGKCRPSLRAKTLENVKRSNLSQTDKDCIQAVFERLIPKKPTIKLDFAGLIQEVKCECKYHYCPCCKQELIATINN